MDRDRYKISLLWFYARRLLFVAGLFSLSRLIFYGFHSERFASLSLTQLGLCFLEGLRFDLAAILLINLPYLFISCLIILSRKQSTVIEKTLNAFFLVVNGLALFANSADILYYGYINSRTNFEIFSYLGTGNDFSSNLFLYIRDYWEAFLIWGILFALLVLAVKIWPVPNRIIRINSVRSGFSVILAILLIGIGIRGGLVREPINLSQAASVAGSKSIALIVNTPFNIIWSALSAKNRLNEYPYGCNRTWFNPLHTGSELPLADETMKKNIVVIILEGFASEYSAVLRPEFFSDGAETYTPFLDSLMQHSMVFTQARSNALRTIEALPAILSSHPHLINPSLVLSDYNSIKIQSLPRYLKPLGYTSHFFHGGNKGTMGFDIYCKMAGFDYSYFRQHYPDYRDYDGHWGIFDGPFLQFAAGVLNHNPQPFFAAIMTLSSHHPYTLPPGAEEKFRKGTLPIHQSVLYADHALGAFINAAMDSGWGRNTLFVITADHTETLEYTSNRTSKGIWEVPLVFYEYGRTWEEPLSDKPVQHADIMPGILQQIGYPRDYVAFGNKLFNTGSPSYTVHFINDLYLVISDTLLMEHSGKKPLALYHHINDPLLRNNLIKNHEIQAEQMSLWLRALLCEYHKHLRSLSDK